MKLRDLFGPEDGLLRAAARRRNARRRAARVRRRRDALTQTRFIAVTGSGGKTTTTALLGAILAECGSTHVSLFANTLLGLSKRIGDVERSHAFAAFEVGMDAPGGIALAAHALNPDVAVVTGIGLDHRKTYRTKEAIAEEKGALFAALPPGAIAVLNADDPMMPAIAARTRARIVTFGTGPGADIRGENVEAVVPGGLRLDVVAGRRRLALETGLIGRHWAVAVLAAVAAARALGAPDAAIARAAASFQPVPCRCSLHVLDNGACYILDTVKAPFDTIGLAIDLVRDVKAPRRTIIIGSISDYAGTARVRYRKAYELARAAADRVIFYGDHAARVRPHEEDVKAGRFFAFEDLAALAGFLDATGEPGEVVLVKGAGADHLERLAFHQQHAISCWEGRCGLPGTCTACERLRKPAR